MSKSTGGIGQDIGVRVHQYNTRVGRQPGVLEEVAGARSDIEVSPPHAPRVLLYQATRRASPHQWAVDSKYENVVDPEKPGRVVFLTAVGGVRPIHRFADSVKTALRHDHRTAGGTERMEQRSICVLPLPRHGCACQ